MVASRRRTAPQSRPTSATVPRGCRRSPSRMPHSTSSPLGVRPAPAPTSASSQAQVAQDPRRTQRQQRHAQEQRGQFDGRRRPAVQPVHAFDAQAVALHHAYDAQRDRAQAHAGPQNGQAQRARKHRCHHQIQHDVRRPIQRSPSQSVQQRIGADEGDQHHSHGDHRPRLAKRGARARVAGGKPAAGDKQQRDRQDLDGRVDAQRHGNQRQQDRTEPRLPLIQRCLHAVFLEIDEAVVHVR